MGDKLFILSGAGLSAESGLRTFRDSDGLWEEYDVMEVCSIEGWEKDRQKVTRFYNDRRAQLVDVQPNAAHYAIAQMMQRYPERVWNLTQNVDDLLERAGCPEVHHLHGTLIDLRCESCAHSFPVGTRAQKEDESCPRCGSHAIRHNVVMFGEMAPMYRLLERAARESGMFVAIGTSGAVIDVVPFARAIRHSVLINPKREPYGGFYGSAEKTLDSHFTHSIFKTATGAAAELSLLVDQFFQGALS